MTFFATRGGRLADGARAATGLLLELLARASGDPQAALHVGLMYYAGTHGAARGSHAAADVWLRHAAAAGEARGGHGLAVAQAQLQLVAMHVRALRARPRPRDPARALPVCAHGGVGGGGRHGGLPPDDDGN